MRAWITFAIALLVAAPLLLGPCAPGAVRLLGGEPEHTCACGMSKPGECGCPECAVLEKQKQEAKHVPIVRGACDDEGALAPALGAATLPAAFVLAAARSERAPLATFTSITSQTSRAPPTPPPRA